MGKKQTKSTDWAKIRTDYVMGKLDAATGERVYPLQVELARKYEVSEASISLHCSKEGWQTERDKYLQDVQDALKKRTKKFDVASLEEVYREHLGMVKVLKSQWVKNKKKLIDEKKPFDVYDRDMLMFMKHEKEISELIHGTDDMSRIQDTPEDSQLKGYSLKELIELWKLNKLKNG